MEIFGEFFWNFLDDFFGGMFMEEFFGRNFLEGFFGRIFLGGTFQEELFVHFVKVI